ncbi:response regulator [Mucilaginibacter corticis]|nr:response regulator transcription factor [Mucilaginibacter corticis]
MKKRIVLVEDNPRISEGFAAVIDETPGYQVTGNYATCEAALKNLAADAPDLVLMDIDLPGIDGIEGTQRIKKLRPDCIVLIITVLEDSEKVFRSLCAGAGGYIVKKLGQRSYRSEYLGGLCRRRADEPADRKNGRPVIFPFCRVAALRTGNRSFAGDRHG